MGISLQDYHRRCLWELCLNVLDLIDWLISTIHKQWSIEWSYQMQHNHIVKLTFSFRTQCINSSVEGTFWVKTDQECSQQSGSAFTCIYCRLPTALMMSWLLCLWMLTTLKPSLSKQRWTQQQIGWDRMQCGWCCLAVMWMLWVSWTLHWPPIRTWVNYVFCG